MLMHIINNKIDKSMRLLELNIAVHLYINVVGYQVHIASS